MGNYWIFCHFLKASPVLLERHRGRGSNHQKGQEYLLTYIGALLRGFLQFRGLFGEKFCSGCGRKALRLEIKVSSCLQVRKLASSGLFLKAMPNLSDISCFQQVQKELIRISPKPSFDLYSREDSSKATFLLSVLGQGKDSAFSIAGASV